MSGTPPSPRDKIIVCPTYVSMSALINAVIFLILRARRPRPIRDVTTTNGRDNSKLTAIRRSSFGEGWNVSSRHLSLLIKFTTTLLNFFPSRLPSCEIHRTVRSCRSSPIEPSSSPELHKSMYMTAFLERHSIVLSMKSSGMRISRETRGYARRYISTDIAFELTGPSRWDVFPRGRAFIVKDRFKSTIAYAHLYVRATVEKYRFSSSFLERELRPRGQHPAKATLNS